MPGTLAALMPSTQRRIARAWPAAVVAALAWLAAPAPRAAAVTVRFNFDYDPAGFFGTSAAPTPARRALEFAARAFSAFTDTLTPIVPGGNDAWTARFFNPSTGSPEEAPNLFVPTNEIIIYAGARNLSGSRLAEATRGWHTFDAAGSLTPTFVNAVINRGQGSTAADYAPWGGSIAFDTTESDGDPRLWNFDPYARPMFPTNDFLSSAMHELAHLFGFGFSASGSFQTHVQGDQFTGPAATALYGGPVPLQVGGDHWDTSVVSPPFAVDPPRAALGPLLFAGERLTLTPLDYAALADVGWAVPPELLRLPGDVNGDSRVDGADFLTWQRGLGGFGGTPGDADGDLFVDDYDGWIVRQYLGAVGADGGELPAGASVSEPGASTLLVVTLILCCSVPLPRWGAVRG